MPSCLQSWGKEHDVIFWVSGLNIMLHTRKSCTLGVILPLWGRPRRLSSKESTCNAGAAGDMGLIPGSGRSPGEGNGNLLHYSCLENSMDRGAWWDTTKRVGHDLMTKPQQRNKSVQITETLLSALWGNTQHWNCCIIWNFCVKIFG